MDVDDDDYFDIDRFLNLDGLDEDASVGASAGPQPAPAALVQPLHPMPDVHAAAPSVQVQRHLPPPAVQHQQHAPAAPIQDQQMLGEPEPFDLLLDDQMFADASAYGLVGGMPMPAPIAHGQQDFQAAPSDYVQHPQDPVTAVQHQQILGEASAYYGFDDGMPMMAPIAHGQHGFQAAPSDHLQHLQVPATAVQAQHQQILGGEASAYGFGFQDQIPTPPSGGSEEDDSSEMVREYLMQNGDYGISVDFVSDQAVNNGGGGSGGGATGLREDEMDFVPLWTGRLQCDHCRVVRKVRFYIETGKVFIFLHSAGDGSFQHAIMEINYHGDDSQAPKLYIDFSRQTREVVLDFMRSTVESLRNEPGGAVEDSDDAAQTSNIIEAPPPPQDAEPPMEDAANNNVIVEGLPAPRIFQSYDEVQKNQPSESAEVVHSSKSAMQQERTASLTLEEEEEIRQYLHELKEKAQSKLGTNSTTIRSFCRRNNCTWKLARIRKLNNQIVRLGEDLFKFTMSKLMTIRKRVDECVIEKAHIFDEITRDMKKERKTNDNEAGPSRTKKGGAK